jgi:adenylosuccinate lyase
MTSRISGNQWNEGDVACSVVRRVALPGAFFAIDGLLETAITVLRQMEIWSSAIEAEIEKQLPFLLTTTVLMESVKLGVGRETAHEIIKEHALEASRKVREGGDNDLFDRLAQDERLKLSEATLNAIAEAGRNATGRASDQVERFLENIEPWRERFPGAADYVPDEIL